MTAIVVDASVALTWCFADEAAADTDAILDRLKAFGAFVPSLWHIEMANVLLMAERRGRTIVGGLVARLDLLAQLPITTDTETTSRAWREIVGLARTELMTTYDAAYLELAMRRGVPLATRDADLAKAARRAGVSVLP
ncbi:MAG TPA: type II toxin-antitoxin system VapC family toxin [Stellaceae bacterium]|nr:type II toxin-antitoxin system VapC family toxin [Stellaceae bacterium]